MVVAFAYFVGLTPNQLLSCCPQCIQPACHACHAKSDLLICMCCADVSTDVGIRYRGLPQGLTAYEQTAAAFIFLNFLLAIAATIFAMKVRCM